jgi:hypothetical protein
MESSLFTHILGVFHLKLHLTSLHFVVVVVCVSEHVTCRSHGSQAACSGTGSPSTTPTSAAATAARACTARSTPETSCRAPTDPACSSWGKPPTTSQGPPHTPRWRQDCAPPPRCTPHSQRRRRRRRRRRNCRRCHRSSSSSNHTTLDTR